MKMKPIDFEEYNGPPFFPEWMSKGETFDLIKFDDFHLVEIDEQIRLISDQFDLDKSKAVLLDRIGKIVSEARNGNDDKLYRLLIRLRTMLNTTTGSIPELIKVIKFLYGSEVVHIVPDYPAGLIILHDGEGPDVNFNEIIRQVVGAGIDYSQKELFYFTEDLLSSEKVSIMKSKTSMMDSMASIFHNGVYRRNGQIRHRYNGVRDILTLGIDLTMQDQLFGRAIHNGLFKRNGTITHSGFTNDVATELWSFLGGMDYAETVPSSEETNMALAYQIPNDGFEQDFRRNGKFRRNGEVQHTNRYIMDKPLNIKINYPITESLQGQALHNGLYKRNGTIKHGLLINTSITEKNNIRIDYSLQDSLAASEGFSIVVGSDLYEIFHCQLRRNGYARRNGQYNRATGVVDAQKIDVTVSPLTDTMESSESFSIWYRKHYKHNGRFRRNGIIKHDSNVLLLLGE